MGAPIVFHTAPPHPASNARMICSPQFVGGADASQNGLRHGIPQKVVSSVGLGLDMLYLQPRGNADAGALSVRNRVPTLAAAIRAIPTSKKLRIGSLARCVIDDNASAFKLNLRVLASGFREKTRVRPLSDRQNDKIYLEQKLRAWLWDERPILGRYKLRKFNPLDGLVPINTNRLNMPQELHSLVPGRFMFEGARRHLLRAAPAHNMHFSGSKPNGCNCCIDSGVSSPHHHHALGHRPQRT